jgi:predicted DsbA family dithiol-disulfide isomerase
VVDLLKAEYKVDVEWRPYYLRPDTPPEGMDLPAYIIKARASGADERLQGMAKLHGMEFKSPDRIYNTRIAHEATEFAREHGKGLEFHRVVFRKVYAEGLDISQWDILRSAAEEVGLDADDMQSVVDGGKYTAEVAAQVRQAQEIGVTGVPTYVINDRYAIVGAQPIEAFKRALAQILKK